jgi:PAS domain S-box-containing protein
MKNTLPEFLEKAISGIFESDNGGKGKEAHTGLDDDFFFNIAQNANDIIFHAQLVPEIKFDYVSPSCLAITGYTPEEFYADPLLAKKCWHPEELNNLEKMAPSNYMASSAPQEIRWIRKDGTEIWIEHLMTFKVNEEGIPLSCQIIARDITARKKAEEAYQEHQIFTNSLLEHAPHATVVINADTSIRYVNPAWERLNGWALSEVVGIKAPYPWWPKDDNGAWLSAFMESFKQKGGQGELPAVKKNGETYWIDIRWTAVHKDGQLDYLLINSTDTTERKKAEKALQDSEGKFSKAFHSSPDIMAITTVKDGRFIEVNESYIRQTGYTREEVIGHSVDEINSWAIAEDRAKMLKMMAEDGRIYNQEFRFNTKSGKIQTLLFSMEKIMIGDEPCYISVSHDISKRKKAEEALKESEEKFSKVYNFSPNAICLASPVDRKFIEANESFYRFTGYSQEEIIGHSYIDLGLFQNPEDQQFIENSLIKTGQVFNRRIALRMKSGELRAGLYSADTIEIGGRKRIIIVMTDINEQVKATEALRESEEKFSRAFRYSPEIIAISRMKDGKYLDVNESFLHFTGYTREEVIGKTARDISIWANDFESAERFHLLHQQGSVNSKEYEFRTKSGEVRTWLYSAEHLTIGGESCIMSASIDITERKRMEQELANEAIRRRILIEQSRDGIVILDAEGKVYDANWRFAEMLGYTMEEVSSLYLWDWEKGHTPEGLLELIKNVDSEGDHYTTHHMRKDGSFIDVDVSSNGATFAGQKLVFCVCRDMSGRNLIEKALRESEEKFSRAFNASPISLSISRLEDGKFLEVNESFVRNLGYTRDEIIGRSSKELQLWEGEEQNRIMNMLKAEQGVHNEQIQYRTKSGETHIGLISAEMIQIGHEPCMLVLNNDVTRQRQAEERLKLLSSVTQQVTDCTVITDPDYRITYMNRAAEEMFGYTFDEVKGKLLNIFNTEQPTAEALQLSVDTLKAGKPLSSVMPKRRKDGTIIICDCCLSPMYDEKGNVVSLIDVQRDITKQKDVEAKLQEHKKLIDSILATMPEGVLVIDSHDRIILANKALYNILHLNSRLTKNKPLSEVLPLDQYFSIHRALNSGNMENNTVEFRYQVQDVEKIIYCVIVRMDGDRTLITFSDVSREREEEEKLYLTDRLASIGEMAAGLAHELNNPLTGILTLSQVMVNSDLPKEQKEDVECIYTEAKRAAGIVKNVLLFARNKADDSGRSSANEVLKDVLRLREYEQRSNNIKVVTELEENLPDITIDKGQLQQVFLNMISNAEAAIREANRPGLITVTTQRVNNHINIHFSDNGCGIKKQVMPRIFDPFFTTKEVGKGTGLGLSICYSMIVKHGGKISVKSQVNEGTTFTIRMPIINLQ